MKVKDALIILQNSPPENELVIRDFSRLGLGTTSTLPISDNIGIVNGFDWDNGKTIIYPEQHGTIKELLNNPSISGRRNQL